MSHRTIRTSRARTSPAKQATGTLAALRATVSNLNGRPYPALKSLKGSYSFARGDLRIDHVQGDPFASPSTLAIRIDPSRHDIDLSWFATAVRRRAVADFLHRRAAAAWPRWSRSRGSGHSGQFTMPTPGQQVLWRACAQALPDGNVVIRFRAGLPARGRRIDGPAGAGMLCEDVPSWTEAVFSFDERTQESLEAHVFGVEDAVALREQLAREHLIAFLANESRLPRRSGEDDRPVDATSSVALTSPPSLEVTLETPHSGSIRGLGIPTGVTTIVGGGFHGKSTLLQALELGVYDHIPGDGRERVVTCPNALKVRAEDGRAVAAVDISMFIDNLPGGLTTSAFTTSNASGSTSQAAALVEAIEAESNCLLLDEDTCATNLMVHDPRMREIIASEHEPITPFVRRVRTLWEERQISTVLVVGSEADFFQVSDHVIGMVEYVPRDLTKQAHALLPKSTDAEPLPSIKPRRFEVLGLHNEKRRVRTHDVSELTLGRISVRTTGVGHLVGSGQLETIGRFLFELDEQIEGGRDFDRAELCALWNQRSPHMAEEAFFAGAGLNDVEVRFLEMMAVLSRLRTLGGASHANK